MGRRVREVFKDVGLVDFELSLTLEFWPFFSKMRSCDTPNRFPPVILVLDVIDVNIEFIYY
jgi:hypothetical protein